MKLRNKNHLSSLFFDFQYFNISLPKSSFTMARGGRRASQYNSSPTSECESVLAGCGGGLGESLVARGKRKTYYRGHSSGGGARKTTTTSRRSLMDNSPIARPIVTPAGPNLQRREGDVRASYSEEGEDDSDNLQEGGGGGSEDDNENEESDGDDEERGRGEDEPSQDVPCSSYKKRSVPSSSSNSNRGQEMNLPPPTAASFRAGYMDKLHERGFLEKNDTLLARLGHVSRYDLFSQIKFVHPSLMGPDGPIAKRVRQQLGVADDNQSFSVGWLNWMHKHVRRFINEKRSACAQSIMKHILKGT